MASALKVSLPELPLNQQNSDEILLHMKEQLLEEAKKQGYGEFIG